MLPKKERVSRVLFNQVLKNSHFFNFNYFTLRVLKNPESRFSFVISGKVSKKAVERNKLRRRSYSIIRKNKEKIKQSFICLFFYKKGVLRLSFKELEDEILTAMRKASVL